MGYRFSLPAGWPNVQNVASLSLFLSSTTNSSFGNITSQISLFSLIPTPSVYAQLCSYGYPTTDYTYNGAKRGQNLAICSKIFGPAIWPSFVIWPINNIGVVVSLANLMSSAVHSFICEILPAADSIKSLCSVCIESMITKSGVTCSICLKIFWVEVSGRRK